MSDKNIELKSVNELLGMKFHIPSYQRGYRWTDLQIENLLNDILEFSKGADGDFYCLQPLVVKERKKDLLAEIKQANSIEDVETLLKGEWIVIDGQQRLTTIYLILKALEDEKIPSIEYERESYIEVCDSSDEIKKDNIEIYQGEINSQNPNGIFDQIISDSKNISKEIREDNPPEKPWRGQGGGASVH